MFRWYQRASKCYVYLSDVRVSEEVRDARSLRITWEDRFRRSRWFSRGWTLQELLAPPTVEFFSQDHELLGSKLSLEFEIHRITKVPIAAFRGQQHLSKFSVEEVKCWAVNRQTMYHKDKVYCLLRAFGVFLPLIYGEGKEYAFQRLKEEMQRRSKQNEQWDMEVLQDLPGMFL